jgi:tetratricopeptide (TPR) repeat protein
MFGNDNPLDVGPLSGQAHQDAVDELWQGYLDTIHRWRPRLVNVLGETGVGKTRVVQEFYKRVVSKDPYWPKELHGLNQRKTVAPSQQVWEGFPTLLWLGLSCFAHPDGRPWPVLEDGLRRQLRAHARGILLRDRRSAAVRRAATKAATAVGSLLGAEAVKGLIEITSDMREVKEIAQALTDAKIEDDLVSGKDVIDAVLKIARLLNAEGQPIVIILDDAHDADPLTLEAVERLLDSTQGVYVVATSWPTAVSRQRQEDKRFGGWLTRIELRRAVTRLLLPPLSRQVLTEMAAETLKRAGRYPVHPEAAAVLGERSRGNALLLSQLISMVIANDASVTRDALSSLALLPVEPEEIFREVWLRFLAPPVQSLLQAAAVLGTPVDEDMLMGATAELRNLEQTAFEQEINSALVAGWLVAIPDPYSSRRRLRFSERLLADVADGFATQLIPPTRERMVAHATLCALGMSSSSSVYARTAALQHAATMLEARVPPGTDDLAAGVFTELAGLIWRRDRPRAAQLMRRTLEIELSQRREPDTELLLNTSAALSNIGDIDAALEVFDLRLPTAYLIKAEHANMYHRCGEAYTSARDGLKAELATAGSVAPNPIFDADGSVIICLVRELCAAAVSDSSSHELRAGGRETLISAVRALSAAGELVEGSEVATVASDFGILDAEDSARLERLSVPIAHGPDDEVAVSEFDRLAEARLLIEGGDFAEADRCLVGIPLYLRSPDAVAVADSLARLGGPQYARSLGRLAHNCCRFTVALDAFERSMRYELGRGQPLDAPLIQEIRSSIVESAACAEEVGQARATAHRSLEIARRAQNEYDFAKALLGVGYVHVAQRQFDDAERQLLAALHSLPRDAQSSVDAARISAARCDVLAVQMRWTEIQELLAGMPASAFWHFARHSWRLRGWRLVAGWRASPGPFERSLLESLNVTDRLARPALRTALEYLGREMDGPAGGASVPWNGGDILLGLVGTLLEADRDDLAGPLLEHRSHTG